MDENNNHGTGDPNAVFKTPINNENGGVVDNQSQNIFEDMQKKQDNSSDTASDSRLTINSIVEPSNLEVDNNLNKNVNIEPTPDFSQTPPQPQVPQQPENLVPAMPTGVVSPQQPQAIANNYLSVDDIPQEARRWNWGAFWLSWIWGIGNRVWISLIAIIPAANLIMSIILGIKGSEWAWKTGRFSSIEQFQAVQKKWAVWGLVIFIVSTVLSIGVIAFMVISQVGQSRGAMEKAMDASNKRALQSAVYQYQADKGSCPRTLGELVPYYIKEIPKTSDNKNYSYSINGDDCVVSDGSSNNIGTDDADTTQSNDTLSESSNVNSATQEQQEAISEQLSFANSLQSCNPYKAEFKHILTGDILQREIVGIVGGKCVYNEQMPNNGNMECKLTEPQMTTMADYYKQTATLDEISYDYNTENVMDSSLGESTYTQGGETYINPMQELYSSGACVISGYDY